MSCVWNQHGLGIQDPKKGYLSVALPFIICVNFSELSKQVLMYSSVGGFNSYFTGLSSELNIIIVVKHLPQWL